MVELKVKDIIERKKLLIKGLEENIFKDFTEEEENLLHPKHGMIKVSHRSGAGKVYEGITGAFKVGLPLIIDSEPTKIIQRITMIDWDSSMFQDADGEWFIFEFTPIRLYELSV